VVWVEVEGVLFKFWSGNTFKRLAAKWGELLDVFWVRAKEVPGWLPELLEESDEEVQSDDGFMEGDIKVQYTKSSGDNSEVAEVLETNFDESVGPKVNLLDDPFGIYPLLNKNSKENKENVNEKDQSLKYPSGFTPNTEKNNRKVNGDKSQKCNKEDVFVGRDGDSTNRGSKGDALESTPNAEENDMNVNAVYAPYDPRDKRMLWDYLVHTINQWDGEVVIMGDFNEVRHKSDRFGSIFNGQGADEFNSFIANAGLEEVPLGESAFTWCHKFAPQMSKLDRYLSDHRPILLRETSNDYGSVSFRFFHHWIEFEGFNNFVVNTWKTAPVMRQMELWTLDDDIDNGNGSDTVVHKRMEVINALQRIDKLNGMEIAQKTKLKWSVEGDENSRFFHGMLNKKRNQLNIRGVMVDGVWNEKPHDVKRAFFQHFSNRFDKPMEHRAVVDMCYLRSLLIDQQEDLKRMVTKEEAVSHFFTHADIPKGCNPSFIALILKIHNANKVNHFRPISLIGSIYKIIAKILAKRLVRVLGDIVNEVQSAFIAKRQIFDSPSILNEVLQWCKIKKKHSLIFKVDFEKAGWVVDASLFMGIKLSHLVNLSHMFYADDSVFVGQWSDSNINTLIHVLECFYQASGLRMNMSKSKIMSVHVEGGMVKHVASKLGCLTLNTPFYYLGSKVGGSMSRVQAWKEIIDKVKSRLSKWKMKALSIGGRLTLLKSMLGSIPIFHMSIFRVPSSVLHTLESIRSQFFNGHEKTSLWANVIKEIYGEDESMENGKSVNVCTKLSDPSMDYSFRRKTRGGAGQEQLDALMDLVSTVNLVSMGDRQIARKISLWWNVNYEDVNSYDEWSAWMVSLRLAAKSKLMLEEASSSSKDEHIYDVFLSFRGADTRNSFTNHLHKALENANLKTILDDKEIETGLYLKPELERAIRASRASIIVMSKNYASSTWCLNELVLILEQHREFNQIVIPIFYHVDPSDVRKQQNSFGDAMADHKQKMEAETNAEKKK
nr:Toll/interleukin-1 receptor (TIR) domain-containing protein [Tanacetum cinerariifolium]